MDSDNILENSHRFRDEIYNIKGDSTISMSNEARIWFDKFPKEKCFETSILFGKFLDLPQVTIKMRKWDNPQNKAMYFNHFWNTGLGTNKDTEVDLTLEQFSDIVNREIFFKRGMHPFETLDCEFAKKVKRNGLIFEEISEDNYDINAIMKKVPLLNEVYNVFGNVIKN